MSRPYSNCLSCGTPAYPSDNQLPPVLHFSRARKRSVTIFDCPLCQRRWSVPTEEAELTGMFAERANLERPPERVVFLPDEHPARPQPRRLRGGG